jgi:hypothetical protein
VIGALGGIVLPIIIYLLVAPAGPLSAGWGVPIATDTAFAVALMVLLRERVPVELRVFFTAAVIIDDLVAIAIIALFYTESLSVSYLLASGALTILLVALNRAGIYKPLPYAVVGAALWFFLHESGVHATLSGIILAVVTPTLPPPNFRALMAQADAILQVETRRAKERVMRHGLSEPALRAIDYIYFCARQRRRRALVRRFENAHLANAFDHSGSRDRKATRDLFWFVARGAFPHRSKAPRVFVASGSGRGRARRNRLHHVSLHRGRGVSRTG